MNNKWEAVKVADDAYEIRSTKETYVILDTEGKISSKLVEELNRLHQIDLDTKWNKIGKRSPKPNLLVTVYKPTSCAHILFRYISKDVWRNINTQACYTDSQLKERGYTHWRVFSVDAPKS